MSVFIRYALFLLLLFSCNGIYGQSAKKIQWGLEFEPYLSYSGYNLKVGGVLMLNRHEVYAGPKWTFSDSYLIGQGPWGAHLGYRYIFVKENRWQAFFNFDYQFNLTDPFNPLSLESSGKNQLHEFHAVFGAMYTLGKKWRLGSRLGMGGYVEKNKDLVAGLTRSYSGYSNLASFFVTYIIGNE